MQGPRPVSPVLSGLVGEGHHTDPRHVTFTLADAEGYGFCFACAWEVLLDSKQLTIRKRAIALEMLKVLSSMDEASDFLSTHGLASTSLAFCAQVLGVADDALARTVLELAALLQGQTTDKSACIDSIRFQLQTLTWKQARYVLVLLGRLSYGPLIEHLLGALSYPDEDTRTTCTFVLVELLSKSQSDGVHTNAIALLHALAGGAGLDIVRGSSVVERGHLVKALKPRLLSSHEPLRALTMQVIARVCTGSPETVAFYLDEGIAGTYQLSFGQSATIEHVFIVVVTDFVIEASCGASGLVLGSSIGVLTLFSDHPSFGSYVSMRSSKCFTRRSSDCRRKACDFC
ncbi:uncharacterized protein ACA1_248400 [Acanthamoeba castellanii str. Neff]|uniref:Uncharacterized protein n=1 Tax=Acanthamoeba castellanii (strain ATCC 30010 / Neff) TaxID=1257118 RepID=L8H0C9_ACACF|nr:uncharacterized protein ACA1_248400 [Acanthamoeba castellanii str. Neff]ELR17836.1 hypothetical protein ACA1_248400 [Acanthamoeba castellanii str. Neff]